MEQSASSLTEAERSRVDYSSPTRVSVGFGLPVLVNLSMGAERAGAEAREQRKLRHLLRSATRPDMLMDLSVVRSGAEIWQFAREEFDGPIGLLPHYRCFDESKGLDANKLMRRIRFAVEGGINFLRVCPRSR
jgi:thiamine biosynthesis protein ThiC